MSKVKYQDIKKGQKVNMKDVDIDSLPTILRWHWNLLGVPLTPDLIIIYIGIFIISVISITLGR